MRSNYTLVTGAAGFIGAALVKKLENEGNNVIAAVYPDSDLWRLHSINNLKLEKVDLTDYQQVKKLFDKYEVDRVAHLATHGVYTRQKNDIDAIIIGNYKMSFNLFDYASKTNNIKKFINSGSVFEYGTRNGKVSENDITLTDVLNDYSASKFATTALAAAYYNRLPILTLRYFTAYGPQEDESRFVRASIVRAKKGEDLIVVPNVVRDFVYIQDIVDGIVKALSSNHNNEVINIGSGEPHTLESVAQLIIRVTKSNSKVVINNEYKRTKDSACWADITKARKLIKWEPKYTIAKGIRETVKLLADK